MANPLQPPKEPIDKKAQEAIKKKLAQLKTKVEAFKKKFLKKHDKNTLGICLLPPERFEEVVNRLKAENLKEDALKKRLKEEQEKMNVLLLIDDSETKTPQEKIDLIKKTDENANKIASDIDKNIRPQSMLMSEVSEACYDGKYEILQLLATGLHIYDKKDVLGAIKISEVHKAMVLRRFEKYIVSYVAVGSVFRGDASSADIDVAIIIDDTDVKRMSRAELRDKLMSIIRSMGYEAGAATGVKKVFHIQVYILTDFWDGIRDATPVFFTFLRDGIPLYDRGIFMPQKLLLNMGRIKPSPEAIEQHMDVGERLIDRAKGKMLGIVVEDIYYAAMNPSQSALMLKGYPPSTPKETIRFMEEVFVKKEKLLTQSELKILIKTHKLYKDIEHGKLKEVTGKEIDYLLKETSEYVKKIKVIVKSLEKKSLKNQASEFLDTIQESLINLMKTENLPMDKKSLINNFAKLVRKGHFTKKNLDLLKLTLEKVKKATSKEELSKHRRESATVRKKILSHIQRKRGKEIERARIRIKHGDKFGEVYLLDNKSFIIDDIDAKTKVITVAKITPSGGLSNLKGSTPEELEKALSKTKIPKKVFIKEPIFEHLKKIYGKDIEVLVSN
jgi:uncharacterized protein (UPF0332 family)